MREPFGKLKVRHVMKNINERAEYDLAKERKIRTFSAPYGHNVCLLLLVVVQALKLVQWPKLCLFTESILA